MIEQLRQEQIERIRKKRKKQRKRILFAVLGLIMLLIACAGGILLYSIQENKTFEVTYYNHYSEKINEPVKMALLADLHCSEFGPGNSELIGRIKKEAPDLILIAGDMVMDDNPDVSVAVDLCKALVEVAPVYYCYGNHEGILMHDGIDGEKIPLDEYIEQTGAVFFRRSYYTVEVNGNWMDIGAVPQGLSGYEEWGARKVEELEQAENFKLLLSHHPDLYYEKVKSADIDLAVAGHFHGGLIRIPGLGGLFHPDGGFFPEYAGGQYQLDHAELIVSRGLGNSNAIPRINNKPELVMINLMKK